MPMPDAAAPPRRVPRRPARPAPWLAALLLAAGPAAAALNDTGITFCADDASNSADCASVAADGGSHPRQDARFGRDAAAAAGQLTKVGAGAAGFDYTKIANDGSELPADAAQGSGPGDWACTRDNVTGLIWEVKTDDGGLRDKDWTYTWYFSDSPDGNPGTANGGTCYDTANCDTEKYAVAVNGVGLCGASDWRVPTWRELASLVNYARSQPTYPAAIDTDYFVNTRPYGFWSSSPKASAAGSAYAWFVHMWDGEVAFNSWRGSGQYVRLVRGGL